MHCGSELKANHRNEDSTILHTLPAGEMLVAIQEDRGRGELSIKQLNLHVPLPKLPLGIQELKGLRAESVGEVMSDHRGNVSIP